MQNTTADYKLEINKPSRSFECKITIGDNIYNNEDIVNMTFDYLQANEGFSIGNTVSQTLDLTLLNKGDIIYSTSQIKVEIGLKIGSKIEYILMGIFNIDDIEKTDYTTKLTAYDNMIKFETAYFSELGDNPTLQQVVNELEKKTGVQFIGNLPAYTVSKLEGFSCREVLSYVASICGGNALITRDGTFTIKELTNVEKSIDGNNYFDYTREEVKYKIGQVTCQVDENNILSKGSIGTDSMELQFENPWITESILNDIYNKLKSVEYLGYSMKWQGDISLDPFDVITVTDVKNVTRSIPILSQKFSYTGGLTSEIGAKGETKNKNSFSSNGSNSNKLNRVVMEQAIIKEALIEKANIKDLEVSNAKIENLQAKTATIENAIIGVAYIKDLTVINANIDKLIANDVTINNALINKADITELNAVKGNITSLNSQIANIQTLVNGNLSSENIQAGGITGVSLNMDTIFVKDANMINVNINALKAGDISTNKFRIVSDNGGIEIIGATQQFKDRNNKVRIQMGQDAAGNFNFILRGEDGTSTLIDHTGIKPGAIADGLIVNDMIGDGEIGGKKIDISSMVTELNKDTNTSVIKSSKVQLDTLGQTLDIAFNSLKTQSDNNKSKTESNSTTIGVIQGQISTAINNTQIVKDGQTILLKDDYNRTVSKVDSINSTLGSHKTLIDANSGNITNVDTKVNSVQRDLEGTKSIISSNSSRIDGLNSTVSNQGSSISQLQNQISLKVEQSDITTAVGKLQIGGRNLLPETSFKTSSPSWNKTSGATIDINSGKAKLVANGGDVAVTSNPIKELEPSTEYTLSVKVEDGNSIGGNGLRLYYKLNNVWKFIQIQSGFNGIAKTTFTTPQTITHKTQISFDSYNTTSGTCYVSNFKLEKGNKSTDWTPAPEDVDNSINNVDAKVTSVTSTANTALNNANSAISKADTAQGTANTNKNNISTLNTTVSQTNSKVASIETNLSGITQRVSATESTTTTITNKLNDTTSKIDNLKLGGRNLALATSNAFTQPYSGFSGVTNTCPSVGTVLIDGLKTGDIVTVRVIYKHTSIVPTSGQTAKVWLQGNGDVTQWNAGAFISSPRNAITGNGEFEILYSFTINSDHLKNTKWYLGFRHDYIASGSVQWKLLKIEKGTRPTDWTPAPEDVKSSINTVDAKLTTTNNKVSTIETNLNSITSRVSATESTTATINGNITNLQSRMNTAEQKITATAIVNTVSETINNGTASINTVSTVLNKSGLSVYNGAFTLYDKFKNKVFYADSSGNVNFTGNLNPSSGIVNLFGNSCRIDGTASAIRMQLNPSNYISVTDKYVRVFNDYTVNNSRYGSLGTDSSGHFTIFNDRTMLKLLGGLSADAIIQARWASDTAYASFAGSDFYQRSTKEDKVMIDDINAVDVIDILKKNKIKQYALKANAEVICDQLGLEDVNLDNVVGVSADKKIGFILEDMTEEAKELITNNDVKSVNLYSMASMLWIIAQKQQEKIEELYKLLSLGN